LRRIWGWLTTARRCILAGRHGGMAALPWPWPMRSRCGVAWRSIYAAWALCGIVAVAAWPMPLPMRCRCGVAA